MFLKELVQSYPGIVTDFTYDEIMSWPIDGHPTEDQLLARKRVLKHIEDHPETHNQVITMDNDASNSCGFVGCLVGHGALLYNYYANYYAGNTRNGAIQFCCHLFNVPWEQMWAVYGTSVNSNAINRLTKFFEVNS